MPLLIAILFALQTPAPPAIDASHLAVSPPRTVVTLNTGKLKGEPWRLAWSEDGKLLYLQTIERDKFRSITGSHHYVVSVENGKVTNEDGEPAWATIYWSWKSGQTAPGAPSERIKVEQRTEIVRATSAPMGGDLARGGVNVTGTTASDAVNATVDSQPVNVFALKWRNELIGEWRNEAVVPGLTFGWAPVNRVALAYADRDGRLFIVDAHGSKQAVVGIDASMLPAWSSDARRLAFLQHKDKKHYTVDVVDIGEK